MICDEGFTSIEIQTDTVCQEVIVHSGSFSRGWSYIKVVYWWFLFHSNNRLLGDSKTRAQVNTVTLKISPTSMHTNLNFSPSNKQLTRPVSPFLIHTAMYALYSLPALDVRQTDVHFVFSYAHLKILADFVQKTANPEPPTFSLSFFTQSNSSDENLSSDFVLHSWEVIAASEVYIS